MCVVGPSSVAAIWNAQNSQALFDEYAGESAIRGLPSPSGRQDIYLHLESAGLLHAFSAIRDDCLIGFVTVLATVLPHYGCVVAVSESFFVAKAHRKAGAGLRLLRAAEDKARTLGAPGLLVSAPYGGDLFKVLPRTGYTETNRIFFKRVQHDG